MFRSLCAALTLLVLSLQTTLAADWPTYRGDAARSGATSETLPQDVAPSWRRTSTAAPTPAWPRDERMQFDRAFHVVVADGTLFFGSSVDGKVTALDGATGAEKWSFFTQGPVRFAPVVWKDRLFVGSDDGFLYCLATSDGSLIRKLQGSPLTDKVLGNARIISRRPVRGGAVVLDDILYYGVGIWQAEGIYIHAIDPQSFKTLWTNDSSGAIYMAQPHGGANAKSGVTAQGYLVASKPQVFVPTGRAVPAAFNRATGEFQFYHLQVNTKRGGTPTTALGKYLYNGGYAYEAASGNLLKTATGAGAIAALPDGVLHGRDGQLQAFVQTEVDSKDRKGNAIKVLDHKADWKIAEVAGGASLIIAGETIVSGGGNQVAIVDLKSKKPIRTFDVDGVPYGLAVADGRLYVSTDQGTITCFATDAPQSPRNVTAASEATPYGDNARFAAAAQEILSKSNITEGYCVDLGCGDGALAFELAKQSKLRIVAIDDNPKNVATARKKLDAAGLYGSRVTVHLGDPAKTEYPKYFGNLVVSAKSIEAGSDSVPTDEAQRLQRPYGGVACFGKPGAMTAQVRGELPNAGKWSHLYSDAANTGSSEDDIKGPLRILWFRDVDLELPSRHGRGPSPLFLDGRLYHEGMDELRAVDAYNGRSLWKFDLPGVLHAFDGDHIIGVSGTGSNVCLAEEGVYVRQDGHCHRLDPATGKVLNKFAPPARADGKPARWGYLACENGILFGSVVNEDHIVRHAYLREDAQMKQLFTESLYLFALDAKTGDLLWRYDPQKSIRNNAIAVGDGRVFLIDRALAVDDLLSRAPARRGEKGPAKEGHATGELIVLDAKTGKQHWSNSKDIFGTMLVFSEKFDMLMMSYQSTRFKLPSEVGGRMAVFRASEGYRVWDKKVKYVTRPILTGRTIYAQGGSWDLLTGDDQPFDFTRSYGCGQIAASKNLLLFRSATMSYKDLTRDAGTENFGGVRPGCWINTLPVGGLVLVPDASAGCKCSYQNRSWVALQGSE